MSRFYRWALLGLLTLALGGGGYYFLYRDAGIASARQAAALEETPAERVATVEAASVATDTVVRTINAVGSLKPNEAVVISPEIAGRIARLPFGEGDKVAAGDTLVSLDADILRAEIDKAQSALNLAEANRERAMTLAKQGTGTLRARDEANAAFLEAEANLTLARARLAKATIKAPFSGVVGIRAVSVGAYVNPGDRIVGLADVDPIKVDFRVPALALSRLQPGMTIHATVDAFPGQTFEGKVYVIDPIVDANGRAVRLQARIPNPERRLFPGLFARVRIELDRHENALLIPESAVFAEGDQRYVYRIVDGRAVRTKVELGQRRPGQVEVRKGLDRESVVVTAGQQKIQDGSRVTIVKPETKA